MRRLLRVATLAVLMGVSAGGASAAWAHSGTKVVRFHDYAIRVPASWPVYDLVSHPTVCVRFDRHAVYLGHPSANQHCPAHAVGRTEAVLVSPLAGSAARSLGGAGTVLPSVAAPGAQPRQGSSGVLTVPARGVVVTATWHNNPSTVRRALGVRSLEVLRGVLRPAGPSAVPGAGRAVAGAARAVAHAAGVFNGLGFDACTAPSPSAMSAWQASPFRAIGVYIGGANMGCSQPNLTAAWVSQETAAGWHLIPTYVGLQAPGSCGCASISAGGASFEGAAAAADAVTQAQALGIGKGNPIYYDMEGYASGGSTTARVLAFLSAWTSTLHADGYVSGVYSSGDSGIADFANAYGTGFTEPDDLWIARWNGAQSTSDPSVPAGEWAAHQRLHQYSGSHDDTYGGATINIDSDYLDGATAAASNLPLFVLPDGTFVQVAGTSGVYVIAGDAPLFVSAWGAVGAQQQVTTITAQQFAELNTVPANGTFLTTLGGSIYRIAGGAPLAISSWNLYGGVQPSVTIDPWDIQNISSPLAHLNARPTDGTVVEGLPSQSYWVLTGGNRVPTQASQAAVAVDDAALAAFPVLAVPVSVQCVVPSVRHLTLHYAVGTLRHAHCRLGKVFWPRHFRRHHVLRVTRQSLIVGTTRAAGWRINLTLR
jgi:hypothetical protein